MGRLPILALYTAGGFFLFIVVFSLGSWVLAHLKRPTQPPTQREVLDENRSADGIEKKDLAFLLNGQSLDPVFRSKLPVLSIQEQGLIVETFLNPSLQSYIQTLLRRSLTDMAAVVVLRPDSGRILAMSGYTKQDTGGAENLCLKAEFPAASLFKIIAAAAAIEKKGYTAEKRVAFRGRSHTLYKSQLKNTSKGYKTEISFKRAFSSSINPVFGKIGIYVLGKSLMEDYSDRFFFNREIPFDIPPEVSRIIVPEDDFGLAEVASGFNKRTLISPLHAALITAAVANDGVMMRPRLVRSVRDADGTVLFEADPSKMASPISEGTARQLKILMKETVTSGTCRKAFYPLRRKRAFKGMELGAKTGTINDTTDKYKFDWIAAYAIPSDGDGGICVVVLAVHGGKKLGIRSKDLARHILNHHFGS